MPAVARTNEQVLEFLRTNVYRDKDSDCLLWAGKYQDGTPMFSWHGSSLSVRRLLLRMQGRQINRGQFAYAGCGNMSCVNEAHIAVESSTSRTIRTYSLGRNQRGNVRGLSVARGIAEKRQPKLSLMKHSRELADMLASGRPVREIAEHYNCTTTHVYAQVKRWRRMGVAI